MVHFEDQPWAASFHNILTCEQRLYPIHTVFVSAKEPVVDPGVDPGEALAF